MSTSLGDAVLSLSTSTKEFDAGLDAAHSHASKTTGAIGGIFNALGKIGLAGLGIKAITDSVAGLAGGLVSGNAEFERYNVQFGVLLGSAEAAKDRLAELADFGAKTPFELPEVVRADKILQAFGLHAEDTATRFGFAGTDIRTIAGDVAAGTGASFEEIATYLGKFSSGATGEAIARMQELGIVTRAQLTDMGLQFSKSGELLSPLDQSMGVLLKAMKGKFGGMMDAQSGTFEGMMSNLQDWMGQAKRTIMAPLFEVLKDKLQGLLTLLSSPEAKAAITAISTGLANGIGLAIDVVGRLVEGVQSLLGYLDPANKRDLMREWFGDAGPMIDTVVRAFEAFVSFIAENLQPVLAGLGTIFATVVIPLFVSWGVAAVAAAVATVVALAPVLVPIIAIGAAIALLYKAWTEDWGGIREIVASVWAAIQPVLQAVFDTLSRFWLEIQPNLQRTWQNIQDWTKAAVDFISNVITTVVGAIVQFWTANWETISGIFEGVWLYIKGYFTIIWAIISGLIKVALAVFSGDWTGAWNAIKEMVAGVWQGIKLQIEGALLIIKGVVDLGWKAISGIIMAIVGENDESGLRGLLRSAFNAIPGLLLGALAAVSAASSNLGNAIRDGIIGGIRGTLGVIGNLGAQLLAALKSIINSAIDAINDAIPNDLTLDILGHKISIDLPDNPLPHLALGTSYWPGGLAIVGERGPELVAMPRGSAVYSADKTRQMAGNTYNMTVNTNAPVSTVIEDFSLLRALAGV